jgi:hypothetical protein
MEGPIYTNKPRMITWNNLCSHYTIYGIFISVFNSCLDFKDKNVCKC